MVERRLPSKIRRRMARRYALSTLVRVRPMRLRGMTLQECCDELNGSGWRTFTGRPWSVGHLSQVVSLGRAEALDVYVDTKNQTWLDHALLLKGKRVEDLIHKSGDA